MIRWLVLCVILCAVTVGVVLGVSHLIAQPPGAVKPPVNNPEGDGNPEVKVAAPGVAPEKENNGHLTIQQIAPADSLTSLDNFIVPGRVQAIFKQEVPAERDGTLVFLATEAKPDEQIPENKKLVAKCWVVAIRLTAKDPAIPEADRVIVENPEKGAIYRKWVPEDDLPPGRLRVGYVMKTYRRLVEGDIVQAGQLVAQVDTALARDELASKLSKIDVAQSELETSTKTKEEAKSRYERIVKANTPRTGTYSKEEEDGALLTWNRYTFEELAKVASLVSAQREANASVTLLKKHEVRAQVPGEIKVIYKRADEAVKTLDPVMQVQNPFYLRVEGQLDVQDRSKIQKGMEVTVEPTMSATASLIMSGHLQPVTCVAVSKAHEVKDGEKPWFTIVSGSEDRTVIGWDSRNGHQLWRLPHRAAVKAVACTGDGAERSLALIGTADGSAQIIDLDNLADKKEPLELEKRSQGAILCVAFSVDGKTCATSGEDRTINLWNTATGTLQQVIRSAHRAAVTSLQFTPDNLLVSAGRDNDLNVWSVKPNEPPHRAYEGFDRRGGEVQQLGVSPDGTQVLFDQGKELLVLSLAKRKPEGVLQNFGVSGNFTNMALFAPPSPNDPEKKSKMILTASAAEGRLQLWRTPTKDGRAGELRQFIWGTGLNTCGAFAPNSQFVVTGTQDHKVLLWQLPSEDEIKDKVTGTVSWVDDTENSTRQLRVWVDVNNSDPTKPRRLNIGSTATIVVPPAQAKP